MKWFQSFWPFIKLWFDWYGLFDILENRTILHRCLIKFDISGGIDGQLRQDEKGSLQKGFWYFGQHWDQPSKSKSLQLYGSSFASTTFGTKEPLDSGGQNSLKPQIWPLAISPRLTTASQTALSYQSHHKLRIFDLYFKPMAHLWTSRCGLKNGETGAGSRSTRPPTSATTSATTWFDQGSF